MSSKPSLAPLAAPAVARKAPRGWPPANALIGATSSYRAGMLESALCRALRHPIPKR